MFKSFFFLRWRESVLGRTGGEGTTEKERKREGKGKIWNGVCVFFFSINNNMIDLKRRCSNHCTASTQCYQATRHKSRLDWVIQEGIELRVSSMEASTQDSSEKCIHFSIDGNIQHEWAHFKVQLMNAKVLSCITLSSRTNYTSIKTHKKNKRSLHVLAFSGIVDLIINLSCCVQLIIVITWLASWLTVSSFTCSINM